MANIQLIIGIIAAAIFGYLFIKGTQVKGKKVGNVGKGLYVFIMAVLVIASLYLGDVGSYIDPSLASPLAAAPAVITTAPPTTDSTKPVAGVCPIKGFVKVDGECICLGIEDTTVTWAGQNAFSGVASGGTHQYKVSKDDGASWSPAKEVSDAGTATLSPGDWVQTLYYNASVGASAYFSDVDEEYIPCTGTHTLDKKLYQNSTITIKVFNEDNDLVANNTNVSFDAGTTRSLDMSLQGTFEKGFPWGGIVICEYNSSAFDDCAVDFGFPTAIDVPGVYSLQRTDNKAKAYKVPAIISDDKVDGKIRIEADATINPDKVDNNIIRVEFRPLNYYINQDKGWVYDGPAVEDEDDVATMNHIKLFEIYVK